MAELSFSQIQMFGNYHCTETVIRPIRKIEVKIAKKVIDSLFRYSAPSKSSASNFYGHNVTIFSTTLACQGHLSLLFSNTEGHMPFSFLQSSAIDVFHGPSLSLSDID